MRKKPPCLGGKEEEDGDIGVKVALKNLSLRLNLLVLRLSWPSRTSL